ncbi:MAG: septum formation protein Maf [Rhodospirillaceae bacterium]|nr:septum formation protein Maf [Rhodospirillaceae bacterium]MBT3494943.1 septum formation protein Maf [Rhodospirillaceae bacterium]MBT3780633.1 septum formation protein Maf [Rhodospirillaceae bacterium]MBT3975729.1 septum formation protein Maf [Rhodospirillaceae bacterium]MBT4167444.1 septum formation protein Maf [Rhodospirillaceae bacterium]
MPLILASNSAARQSMLRQAGLDFTLLPSELDEKSLKRELQRQNAPAPQLAAALARAKAGSIAQIRPDALVIGADQVLSCEGDLFDKAADLAAAAVALKSLAGRCHELHAAVCVMQGERLLWQHTGTARLWMRPLSDDSIAGYLDRAGAEVLWSVGCYQIEGLGVQLFERIEGDYFTILGLPLLPLLAFLRTQTESTWESAWQ